MRVLLDTNLVIHREGLEPANVEVTRLLGILSSHQVQFLLHPITRTELGGDSQQARRQLTLWKLEAYPFLESPPTPSPEFRSASGEGKSPNSERDTLLLFAVAADAVDFLITQDKKLIGRATRANLADRVLDITSAIVYFSQYFEVQLPPLPDYVEQGPVNGTWITDPFFDSFKQEYTRVPNEFREWYAKVAREGRPAVWVKNPDGRLGALMIYKDETQSVGEEPSKRRLKICSFKVDLSMQGVRLSEKLLQFAFNFLRANRVDEAYVEVFPSHSDLTATFELFGFVAKGYTTRGEVRMFKRAAPPDSDPSSDRWTRFRRAFPAYDDGPWVKKFIVPIQPIWHERLFPEFETPSAQTQLDQWLEGGSRLRLSPAGNAIRKAYICRSPSQQLSPGDLLLFYRSRDIREVNQVGIVESAERKKGMEAVVDLVGNRTVLPRATLQELCDEEVLVILFWHVGQFPSVAGAGVPLETLPGFVRPPQSIWQIPEEAYRVLWRGKTGS
jgi:L-amino acid N-acyltransferase YncA